MTLNANISGDCSRTIWWTEKQNEIQTNEYSCTSYKRDVWAHLKCHYTLTRQVLLGLNSFSMPCSRRSSSTQLLCTQNSHILLCVCTHKSTQTHTHSQYNSISMKQLTFSTKKMRSSGYSKSIHLTFTSMDSSIFSLQHLLTNKIFIAMHICVYAA